MAMIHLTVTNWEKFNPKRDQKTYTWFRLDNSIATDSDLFALSPEQRWLWIVILCEVSKKNTGSARLNLNQLAALSGLSVVLINDTLKYLADTNMVSVQETDSKPMRHPDVVNTTPDGRGHDTYVRTNERTDENTLSAEPVATASDSTAPNRKLFAKGAIPELADDATDELLADVTHRAQTAWIDLYADTGWLKRELLKAKAWVASNPNRAPKGSYARFLTNWFSSGWERHRKSIQSSTGINTTPIDITKI